MTRLLMISTDAKILEEGSSVRLRMREYGTLFDELHIIIFTKKVGKNDVKTSLSENIFVYPTHSFIRLLCAFDATRKAFSLLYAQRDKAKDFVVTTQDPFETGIVGSFISKKFNIPLNIQIHTDFLSHYFTKGNMLNRIRIVISRMVFPYATSVRVVSNRIKNSLLQDSRFKIKNTPVSVLPIFVDKQKIMASGNSKDIHALYPQFDRTLLMASRLTKEKDNLTALKAFKEVLRKNPKLGLIIVGSGPEERHIQDEVKKLDLSRSVFLLPWASGDDLYSYYKTADIFLLTSLYEGYGITLVESALLGCSLVSTDVGIAPDLLSPRRLCSPKDAGCLASKIEEALADPKEFKVSPEKIASVTSRSKEEYLSRYRESLLI